MEVIEFKDLGTYKKINRSAKIINIPCPGCNRTYSKSYKCYINSQLCPKCISKETCMKKYGVDNPAKSEVSKEKFKATCMEKFGAPTNLMTEANKTKVKQTCLEKYGVDNPAKAEQTKAKIRSTMDERYGCWYTKTQDYIDKSIETNKSRYGAEWSSQTDDIKEKSRQTCLEKYGVDNPNKYQAVKDKKVQTCMERYGMRSNFMTEENKEKSRQTCLQKYGVPYVLQLSEVQAKSRAAIKILYGDKIKKEAPKKIYSDSYSSSQYTRKTIIEYKGERFDSVPEYEFYLKCIDEGKTVIRQPKKLEYILGDKVYHYFPDFEVDGELIEIKGSHFLNKETGKWCNPFDRSQDKKYEAKYDCAVENNVKIIYVG